MGWRGENLQNGRRLTGTFSCTELSHFFEEKEINMDQAIQFTFVIEVLCNSDFKITVCCEYCHTWEV